MEQRKLRDEVVLTSMGVNIHIAYNNQFTNPDLIDNMNVKDLITITINQNGALDEKSTREIFRHAEDEIMEVVKNVVQENWDLYKNYDIKYEFYGERIQAGRNRIGRETMHFMSRRINISL